MENVILKRPFWDGRILHPRGPAVLAGPVPKDAEPAEPKVEPKKDK